jgi:hypothetical protein
METSIGNIWTRPERVRVRVQDMVPLSHIVLSIFRKGSGEYI